MKPKFQEGKIKMIDISDAKYDFSKEEKYVIRWFNENGFTGKIIKQYVSKTVFEISRDGFRINLNYRKELHLQTLKDI